VRIALERDGVSPEGASSPRARWSFTRGGAGAGRLLGRWGYLGRGRMRCNLSLVSLFVFLLFCEEIGVSPVIRGPLRLSPIVAPEPLRWYPLGTRRG
jgi:hypothetical protein